MWETLLMLKKQTRKQTTTPKTATTARSTGRGNNILKTTRSLQNISPEGVSPQLHWTHHGLQNGAWKAHVHSLCPSAPGYSSHGERGKWGVSGAGSDFQSEKASELNLETCWQEEGNQHVQDSLCPHRVGPGWRDLQQQQGYQSPFIKAQRMLLRAWLGHSADGNKKRQLRLKRFSLSPEVESQTLLDNPSLQTQDILGLLAGPQYKYSDPHIPT